MTNMDKKYLNEKGLFESAKRFNSIMEYVSNLNGLEEVDGNGDGLDDMTGLADMGGAAPMAGGDPGMGAAAPEAGAPQDPAMAQQADPNAAGAEQQPQGVPGFNPQPTDEDPGATAEESFDEATPDAGSEESDEEVIDVDELVDGQKRNEEAIESLTNKFDEFFGKFQEFQGELKANADFMAKLEDEFEKRNPTSVEKLTMRSLQSKPFQETPEEYMENDAPENYSPESDNNGVGEPRYTITRDDVRNATDYSAIAKTLRDNENSTLKTLLGL